MRLAHQDAKRSKQNSAVNRELAANGIDRLLETQTVWRRPLVFITFGDKRSNGIGPELGNIVLCSGRGAAARRWCEDASGWRG